MLISFVVSTILSLARANKVVDRIHFEVNAGPNRHPSSATQLLATLRRLSKVFGFSCSVIITAPVRLLHLFKSFFSLNCIYRWQPSICPRILPQVAEDLLRPIRTANWRYVTQTSSLVKFSSVRMLLVHKIVCTCTP